MPSDYFQTCLKYVNSTYTKYPNQVLAIVVLVSLKIIFEFINVVLKLFCYLWVSMKKSSNKKDEDFIYNVEDCPICLQELCDPIRLQCGHVYCLECLTLYCQMYSDCIYKCPVCRNSIRSTYYIEGYSKLKLPERDKDSMIKKLKNLLHPHNGQMNIISRTILTALQWHYYFLLVLTITAATTLTPTKLINKPLQTEIARMKIS